MIVFGAIMMVICAVYTVSRKKPLEAVFGRTVLSVVAVFLYTVASGPDVALAEALLGVMLSTFVYVSLFRKLGSIRVGFLPAEHLFEKKVDTYAGLVYEILKTFAKKNGYDLEVISFNDTEELLSSFAEKNLEFVCGPLVELTRSKFVTCYQITVDYGILVEYKTDITNKFSEFYKDLSDSGRLDELRKNFVGD